jgi:hypothetical protein
MIEVFIGVREFLEKNKWIVKGGQKVSWPKARVWKRSRLADFWVNLYF